MSTQITASGFHPIFLKRYREWAELERSMAAIAGTKEKGDAFEQFGYFYFVYHKDLFQIEEVWCDHVKGHQVPDEIRKQFKIERKDHGIDGLSRYLSGEVEAWQAKFRSGREIPPYAELATFFTEAENCGANRIIANSVSLPPVVGKKKNQQPPILVDKLIELDEAFFDSLYLFANKPSAEVTRNRFKPRPHQQIMVENVVNGLAQHDRGKLIAACGTGKTLAALWVSEHAAMAASKILFLAPSIALVGQTLRQWTMQRNTPFSYLVVCSDTSVNREADEEEGDTFDIETGNLDVSVTTTPEDIVSFLIAPGDTRKCIFCTYQSSGVVEQALKRVQGYQFDMIVFDEAHRTVGDSSSPFMTAIGNERIPARKRLFMTATERLVNPRIKSLAGNAGKQLFSMDDISLYGPTLHRYSFGDAIRDGVIADYDIVLAEVSGEEANLQIEQNQLLRILNSSTQHGTLPIDAEQFFKASFLLKALQATMVSKVIAFHSLQRRARAFTDCLSYIGEEMDPAFGSMTFVNYVIGSQNSATRASLIDEFDHAKRGILNNVRCLSEGVDIPVIDSVYFVDPKTSLIDIVQAIGRALRKPDSGKTPKVAHIILPVRVQGKLDSMDDIAWDESLGTFHSVLQAMRDQDAKLEDEIREINLYGVSGGARGHRIGTSGTSKIRVMGGTLDIRANVAFDDFVKRITLRIAIANSNPSGARSGYSHLGQGERSSTTKATFVAMADYNPSNLLRSLVEPTLARFLDADVPQSRGTLSVNNNAISHVSRLGAIREVAHDKFLLTKVGRLLKEDASRFNWLLKNQLMLFRMENIFPYRLVLEVLLQTRELNHFEFIYGPYSATVVDNEGVVDLDRIVGNIDILRTSYPNLGVTAVSNRNNVRLDLNQRLHVAIDDKDLWGDRSTAKNKFRYLKKALGLFDFVDGGDAGYNVPVSIRSGVDNEVLGVLSDSDPSHVAQQSYDAYYGDWLWLKS